MGAALRRATTETEGNMLTIKKTNLTVPTAETSVEVDKVLADWSLSVWQPALCLQGYALLRAEK